MEIFITTELDLNLLDKSFKLMTMKRYVQTTLEEYEERIRFNEIQISLLKQNKDINKHLKPIEDRISNLREYISNQSPFQQHP